MELKVINVTKEMDKKMILNNLNFEMTGGKIYGLRGKNGAGKTMLLRIICGLVFQTTGKVIINNEELGKAISFPRSVGTLIENPGYIPNYSGFKNLKIVAKIKNTIPDEKIIELMELLGLDSKDNKKVKKYSLGMKQKLGIAMALMEDPDLIILDEPINALDEGSVNIVLELLKQHKKRGALVIVASHDREELEFLADEILIMQDGKLVGHELPRKEEE